MILQSLAEHYETLASQGKLDRPGWSDAKISYALYINKDGDLWQVSDLRQPPEKGKGKPNPTIMKLPSPPSGRTSTAKKPAFLWDNPKYLLGIDGKASLVKSTPYFESSKALHHQLLDDVDSPAARALLAFFDRWEPEKAADHPALKEDWDNLLSGINLVFRFDGSFVHEDPLIRQAWQDCYDADSDGPKMTCLITGRLSTSEATHPPIKGVAGAQSSGASLVSFNAPAFCSYGHEQSLNAPVSKYAAFAYTAALNYLIADREHVHRVGDTTVLFWAHDGRAAYQNLFSAFAMGAPASYSIGDLSNTVKALFQGKPVLWEDEKLDPNIKFYILGISPNAARLSVRFFLENTFGGFLRNIQTHYDRLEIVRPAYDKFETLPLWKMMSETVNQKARDKSPAPNLAGATLRAVLTDTPYPATLLDGVTLRIRAESEVTRGRAAILKAYYLKHPHPDFDPKEVCTVSLNPDSTSIPYNLGRLFSVLEEIQSAANPGINTTIKDKYFNAASATPSLVFPTLINLAQKHLRKLDAKKTTYYSKKLSESIDKLGESFPNRMSLAQQGAFQLGYYHQTQNRYQKKEEKENV